MCLPCSIIAFSQPAHQHTTVVDKQRQMLSSILPACAFSPLPPMTFSPLLYLGRPTHFIRIFVCLSQFLFDTQEHRCSLARPLFVWKLVFPAGCTEVIPVLAQSLLGHTETQLMSGMCVCAFVRLHISTCRKEPNSCKAEK